MAPHQYDIVIAETACQVASLRRIRHEKIRVAEIVRNVPNRNMTSDETSRVNDRAQRNVGDSERKTVLRMRVHDRLNLGTCFVDRAVDESFNRRRPAVVDRITI